MKHQSIEWIGKTLDDDFLLEAKIGQGGFALVFRAKQISLRRNVVVKILRPELAHEVSLVERFRRESHLAAKLMHPNIGAIFKTGLTPEGIPFFVMELIDGAPLSRLLKQGPIAPKRAAKMLRQVADALDMAHEQGITHRDLKPDNIMIVAKPSGDDQVKLLDFGIAREEGGKNLTQTGELIGTPEYMSPEQSQGERIKKSSDIYSLGIVAFELLTGRVPFTGPPVKVLFQHISQAPPKLSEVLKKPFPRSIEDCIAKAIAKHPAHRYPTASEFAIQLYSAIDIVGESNIPTAGLEPKPSPEAKTIPTQPPAATLQTNVVPNEEGATSDKATLQLTEEPLGGPTIREVRAPDTKALNQAVLTSETPQKKHEAIPTAPIPKVMKAKPRPIEEPDDGALIRYVGLLIFGLALVVLLVLLYAGK